MGELKTKINDGDVLIFLQNIAEKEKLMDCLFILDLMKKVTKEKPALWGTSIIGFGSYHYKSERSRQEADWFITGFSPRKANLTLYIMPSVGHYPDFIRRLGKCKSGGSCLYINKLADVDTGVLKELVTSAYQNMKNMTRIKY